MKKRLIGGLVFLSMAVSAAGQKKEPEVRQLSPGATVKREISGGEAHSYVIKLKQGEFLRVVADSTDIDLIVTAYAPEGAKALTVDLLNYSGPAPLSFVAEKTGEHRLEIRADAPATSSAHYLVSSQLKPAADAEDLDRLRAEHLLAEANDLEREGSKGFLLKSIENRNLALPLWRKLADKYWEAYTLSNIGSVYSDLGEKQKALDYYNQGLPLRRAVGDRRGEAITLSGIGSIYSGFGEQQKALDSYNQALPLSRAAGDRLGEAYSLFGIGNARNATDGEQRIPDPQSCISSDELSLWLRDVDAGEMVMIVDACHAAAAIQGSGFKPGPMGSRGLGQLSYDKGMRILTATQAADAAVEAGGSIRQGLLSYALVKEGIEQRKADFKPADGKIMMREWFDYGVAEVPELYKKIASGELRMVGRSVESIEDEDLVLSNFDWC